VGVAVGTGAECAIRLMVNLGGLAPSRLENVVAVLLFPVITILRTPLPVISDVMSRVAQLLLPNAPEDPRNVTGGGALV